MSFWQTVFSSMMTEMLAIEGDFEGFRANAAFLEQNCCDVSKY